MLSEPQNNKIDHVVVFQHGLHGFPSSFNTWVTLLKNKLASNKYHFHIATSNSGFLITHDGIDVGGKRLAEEIEKLRQNLALEKGTKLSLVGHSLGGLYCRYAIGYMFEQGTLENWELKQLITFASPHMGVRKSPSQYILSTLAFFYCRKFISRTGLQLIYEDSDQGLPLLQQMADPEGPYFLALKKFQRRVLYSNISNDIQVEFTSGAIVSTNPFSKITLRPEHYSKFYPHLVFLEDINLEQTVLPNDKGNELSLFKDDLKAEMLTFVLTNLQSITWERYPIHFLHPLGHSLIIGKWSLAVDIVVHAVDTFVV